MIDGNYALGCKGCKENKQTGNKNKSTSVELGVHCNIRETFPQLIIFCQTRKLGCLLTFAFFFFEFSLDTLYTRLGSCRVYLAAKKKQSMRMSLQKKTLQIIKTHTDTTGGKLLQQWNPRLNLLNYKWPPDPPRAIIKLLLDVLFCVFLI